jgi:hypothetical protein
MDDGDDISALRSRWDEEGWLHLRSFFARDQIDSINATVDELWSRRPGSVTVDDLDTGRRCRMSELERADRSHRVKLNDLYLRSETLRDVLLSPRLVDLLADLLGDPPVLCNSLNLERSSEQDNHVDAIYMMPRTPGKLVAIWIALEQIDMTAGPLRLYPKSHLIPPYVFRHGGRYAVPEEMEQWSGWIHDAARQRGLQPLSVPASAGDLIIWHGDLLHGADSVVDPTLTRKSVVGHYFSRSDAFNSGYRIQEHGNAWWIQRRPQAADQVSRILNGIERRVQRARAALRAVIT